MVGIRASEARPDFVANQMRLRTYMERGGTLIVQNQQTDYVERKLPPFPVAIAGQFARHRRNGAGQHSGADASGLYVSEPHHVG